MAIIVVFWDRVEHLTFRIERSESFLPLVGALRRGMEGVLVPIISIVLINNGRVTLYPANIYIEVDKHRTETIYKNKDALLSGRSLRIPPEMGHELLDKLPVEIVSKKKISIVAYAIMENGKTYKSNKLTVTPDSLSYNLDKEP